MSDRNREASVLDAIDEFVDAQMQQESSGYDHNINQIPCRICGDDSHTLPITAKMLDLRSKWHSAINYYEDDCRVPQEVVDELDAYSYAIDDSRIICPGADFIGPWATERDMMVTRELLEREEQLTEFLSGDPSYEQLRDIVRGGDYMGPIDWIGHYLAGLPLPTVEEMVAHDESPWAVVKLSSPWRPVRHIWTYEAERTSRYSSVSGNELLSARSLWALPDISWGSSDPSEIIVSAAQVREHVFLTGTMVYAEGLHQASGEIRRVPVGRVLRLEDTSSYYGPSGWRVHVVAFGRSDEIPTLSEWVTDRDETNTAVRERQQENLPALRAHVWTEVDGSGFARGGYIYGASVADVMRVTLSQLEGLSLTFRLFSGEDTPPAAEQTQTRRQRALPRPSNTPPMWAVDPTRSRRRRNAR